MNNTTYSAGTVSVPAAGLTVTGSGTAWATFGVRAGDMILIGGQLALIASVNSNTSITLKRAWTGGAQSGAAYDILLLDDEVRALIAANSLLQALSGGTLTSLGQIAGAANKMPYWTGLGVMAETDLTTQMRGLLGSTLLSRSGNNVVTHADARITGGAVVSSQLDETAGRITTVGYMGLGGKTPATSGLTGDLNEIRTTGFYSLSTVMKNGPKGEANLAAQLLVMKRNWDAGASIVQMLFPTSTGIDVAYIRIGSTAEHTFGPWRRMVTDGNVIGAASVPNSYGHLGAIIERGSNANGEYTKFADGTMICTRPSMLATYLTSGRLGVSWTFPASFVSGSPLTAVSVGFCSSNADAPFPSAAVLSPTKPPLVSNSTPSNSATNIRVWAPEGVSFTSGHTVELTAMAIGRWYLPS